jgi:hypothetical protein
MNILKICTNGINMQLWIPIQIDHSFTEFLEIVNTKQESEKDSVDNKNGS